MAGNEQTDWLQAVAAGTRVPTRAEISSMSVEDIYALVTDLQVHKTELKAQNEQLREAEQALEAARDRSKSRYEFAPVGLLTLDADGRIRAANLTATGLLGGQRAALIGAPLEARVVDSDRDRLREHCRLAAAAKGIQACSVTLKGEDGRRVPVQLSSAPQPAEDGTAELLTAVVDLAPTGRSATGAGEAHLGRARYLALIEASGELILEWSPDDDRLRWAGACRDVLGLAPDNLPRKLADWLAQVHPEDRDVVSVQLTRARDRREPVRLTCRVTGIDGEPRTFHLDGAFSDGAGQGRMIIKLRDITQQDAQSRRLRIQSVIAAILSLSDDVKRLAPKVMGELCRETQWDYGCLWLADAERERLTWVGGWGQSQRPGPAEAARTVPRGVGLAGRAWANRVPAFALPPGEEPGVPPSARAGLAFPVVGQQEVSAVLVLASDGDKRPGTELLPLLETVGDQLQELIARVQVQQELRLTGTVLSDVQRLAHVATYRVAPYGSQPGHWSEELYRLVGRDPALGPLSLTELMARHVHRADVRTLSRALTRSMERGASFDLLHRLQCSDGTVRHVRHVAQPHFDGDGAVSRITGIVLDISDLKLTEQRLRESEQRMRAVIDNAVDAVITSDGEGTILELNQAVVRIFGYAPEELIGRNVKTLIPEPHRSRHEDYIKRYLATGESSVIGDAIEAEGLRKDGTRVPVRVTVSEQTWDEELRFTAMIHDLTEQRRSEAEDRRRFAALAHNGQLHSMSEMAASLAHELKQPLGAITSLCSAGERMLEADTVDPGVMRQIFGDAAAQARRAAEIIDHLRGFVRRGQSRLEPVALRDVIAQALRLVRAETTAAGIALHADHGGAECIVQGDRIQIEQVLVNLLLNAMEALTEAEVTAPEVRVELRQDTDAGVEVCVCDNGPGIDSEDPQHIFERFYTTKSEGTGLGLAICRSTIECMGGEIWAEQPDQGGTAIRFTLPAADADSGEPGPAS